MAAECSGHGQKNSEGVCICDKGYSGYDLFYHLKDCQLSEDFVDGGLAALSLLFLLFLLKSSTSNISIFRTLKMGGKIPWLNRAMHHCQFFHCVFSLVWLGWTFFGQRPYNGSDVGRASYNSLLALATTSLIATVLAIGGILFQTLQLPSETWLRYAGRMGCILGRWGFIFLNALNLIGTTVNAVIPIYYPDLYDTCVKIYILSLWAGVLVISLVVQMVRAMLRRILGMFLEEAGEHERERISLVLTRIRKNSLMAAFLTAPSAFILPGVAFAPVMRDRSFLFFGIVFFSGTIYGLVMSWTLPGTSKESRNERLLRVTDYDNSAESSAESSVENSYTDDNPQYDGAGSSVSTRSGASYEFRSGPTKTFDAQRTWNRIPFLMSPPTTGFSQNSASSQFTPSSAQTP